MNGVHTKPGTFGIKSSKYCHRAFTSIVKTTIPVEPSVERFSKYQNTLHKSELKKSRKISKLA